jgi:hypothetical protein
VALRWLRFGPVSAWSLAAARPFAARLAAARRFTAWPFTAGFCARLASRLAVSERDREAQQHPDSETNYLSRHHIPS